MNVLNLYNTLSHLHISTPLSIISSMFAIIWSIYNILSIYYKYTIYSVLSVGFIFFLHDHYLFLISALSLLPILRTGLVRCVLHSFFEKKRMLNFFLIFTWAGPLYALFFILWLFTITCHISLISALSQFLILRTGQVRCMRCPRRSWGTSLPVLSHPKP